MSEIENVQYEDDGLELSTESDLSQVKHGEIKSADAFVDLDKQSIIKRGSLSKLDQIKIAAQESGTTLREPKSSCRDCFGRGYSALRENGEPVPCKCLFAPRTKQELDRQTQSLASIQYMKSKNKKMRINVLNKTEQILKEEYAKRATIIEEAK